MPAQPHPGFRFTCQPGCTACCTQKGYVYITEDDLLRQAAFLGMTPRAYEKKYVYRTRHLLRLRKPRYAACNFLTAEGCTIHPVKPVQCRLFPYWPELIESRAEWNHTATYCPGIGQGDLIQIGPALETASEMKRAYPGIYPPPKASESRR